MADGFTTTAHDARLIQGLIRNLPVFSGVLPANLAALGQECWVAEGNRTTAIVDVAGIDTTGVQSKQGG